MYCCVSGGDTFQFYTLWCLFTIALTFISEPEVIEKKDENEGSMMVLLNWEDPERRGCTDF